MTEKLLREAEAKIANQREEIANLKKALDGKRKEPPKPNDGTEALRRAGYVALPRWWVTQDQMDVIELNEAFAAQGLAVLRDLGLADDDARVNPNGGAIALGHPLGASGARLVTTAVNQLHRIGGRYALCTMCIGVGQGIALIVERV